MSFFDELKRRNVIKVAIAYVVLGWLAAQVAEFATENFGAPEWALKTFVVFLMLGLPFVLIFAWAFEMTPEGIKREKDVDRSQSITTKTGRKLDFTIIGVLLLVAGYFVWESRFQIDEATTPAPVIPANAGIHLPSAGEQTKAQQNSIAVLPFANRSRDEDDAFFSDGIHDDLLTQLAKIKDLRVISRTSVMKYKDTQKTIPEIAKELGVSTILEGGIQRAGKRIRINAQLIDVATDQHMWAETFDREMTIENIFDIQSEITRQIVQAVRGELTEEEEFNLTRVPTNNLQAYEAYLQTLSLINRPDYSQDNYIKAEIWAKKAVVLDPEFAQVWSMLVEIHAQAIWIGYDSSPERSAMAKEALDNAIRYGPDLPETIAAKAEYQYRIEQNYKQSVETFKQAQLALPGSAEIMHSLGVAQRRAGFLEESIASFEKALTIDPGYSGAANTMIATLIFMDELERASSLLDKFILRYPDARDLRLFKVQIYMHRGKLESARLLLDSMTPWASGVYELIVTLLPMLERNYEKTIAVQSLPEVVVMADNRGFVGYGDLYKVWAYRLDGDEESAMRHVNMTIEKITSLTPSNTNTDSFELSTLAMAYALAGNNDLALAASRKAMAITPEDSDIMFRSEATKMNAQVLAMAGRREEALAEIERLLQHPTPFNRWMLYLDPRWDFFRDDERFNELIQPLDLKGTTQ